MTTTTRLVALIYSLSLWLCLTIPQSSGFSAVSPPKSKVTVDAEFQDSSLSVPSAAVSPNANDLSPAAAATNNHHVAIVLNTNARGVGTDLVPIAESIFGKDHVYVTTTEEEGKQAAFQLMLQNTSMVIPVGGDGTLSSMINFLCDSVREQFPFLTSEEAMKELPLVAYVPLGTGNGVGSVVGSEMMSNPQTWKIFGQKKRRLRQVEKMLRSFYDIGQQLEANEDYLESQQGPDVIEIPMMEVSYPDSKTHEDTLCFFAGAGFDSLMLQDFQSIKKWAIRTKMFTKTLSSVSGYCVALLLKTLPKCVARQEHNIEVKLTTRDPDTLWVDHRRGDVVQTVGPKRKKTNSNLLDIDDNSDKQDETLLYQGTTGILAAGTSPFYGGGLRLFPFARLTKDKMHLRLGRIHPLRGFFNIPQIFEGSFRDKRSSSFGCLDYIGGDFDVHVTSTRTDSETKEQVKGFPVQHSGESVGFFERFRLRVVKEPVRFVTLMEKRVVKEIEE